MSAAAAMALAAAGIAALFLSKKSGAAQPGGVGVVDVSKRMAEAIATGDPGMVRTLAARLRLEGAATQAAELERVAVALEAERSGGAGAPAVVVKTPMPTPVPNPPVTPTGPNAPVLAGVPADLQGVTLRRTNPVAYDARVVTLQKRLIELGYGVTADGKFGAATESAVIDFQRANNVTPADGIVGPITLIKLGDPKAKGKAGTAGTVPLTVAPKPAATVAPKPAATVAPKPAAVPSSAAAWAAGVPTALKGRTLKRGSPAGADAGVALVQQRLIALGYPLSSGADGKFGPEVEAAVKAFQTANGLKADGVVGSGTMATLGDPKAKGPAAAAAKPAAAAPAAKPAPAPAGGRAPTITAALKSLSVLLKNGKSTGYKAPASSGQAVVDWQQVLFDLGFSKSKPDGKYGDGTEAATRAFQAAANAAGAKSGKKALTVDGIVGPATIARAAEARIMPSGPATFAGEWFGDDMMRPPPSPLPDTPLPGLIPPMAPVPPDPRRALAARVYNMLELAPRGGEDRALVALYQSQEGLKATGYYGPATAVSLAQTYGIVPPKPLYWTESRTSKSKANYRDAMRMFGERDPQRVEEWERAGAV